MHIIFNNMKKTRDKHNLMMACIERGTVMVANRNDNYDLVTKATPFHGTPDFVKLEFTEREHWQRIERKLRDLKVQHWKGGVR